MSHDRYEATLSIIKEAVQHRANLTGAVRLAWPDLGPLVAARYVNAQKLAEEAGVNAPALRSAIRTVAREQSRLSHRFSARSSSSKREAPETKPEPPAPGARLVRAEPSEKPHDRPEPDADGLIDLGDGRRYRRKPGFPRFFEIFEDGMEHPVHVTDIEPKPSKPR